MRTSQLSKFSSQANPEVLNTLREIAGAEGRKFHAGKRASKSLYGAILF